MQLQMVPCSVVPFLSDPSASSFLGSAVSSNPSSLLNNSYWAATVDETTQAHNTYTITVLLVPVELAELSPQSESQATILWNLKFCG